MIAPYYDSGEVAIYRGNAVNVLRTMPAESVNCCITSPPYWGLRDYGVDGQLGLEETPEEYVAAIVATFEDVHRVLRADGTLWLNLGDSYAGSWGAQSRPNGTDQKSTLTGGSMISTRQIRAHPKTTGTGSLKRTPGCKDKDLIGVPWRVAFALQAAGWWLRSDIIWAKPSVMPESVTDRPTRSHEHIFLLAKSEQYYYDADAIAEPCKPDTRSRSERNSFANPDRARAHLGNPSARDRGEGTIKWDETRNKRDVWTVATRPFLDAHFATFPPALILPCVLAGSAPGGVILDPFMGAGTTALVAKANGRRAIGVELNAKYIDIAAKRLSQDVLPFAAQAGDGPRREPSQSQEENECLTT